MSLLKAICWVIIFITLSILLVQNQGSGQKITTPSQGKKSYRNTIIFPCMRYCKGKNLFFDSFWTKARMTLSSHNEGNPSLQGAWLRWLFDERFAHCIFSSYCHVSTSKRNQNMIYLFCTTPYVILVYKNKFCWLFTLLSLIELFLTVSCLQQTKLNITPNKNSLQQSKKTLKYI